jgi:hypothetical protein
MSRFLNLKQFLKGFIKQKPFKGKNDIREEKIRQHLKHLEEIKFGKDEKTNDGDWIY